MESPSPKSPRSGPGAVALGMAVLVVLIAMVIGMNYLPAPYYAIAEVMIYAELVWLVTVRLRACLRLARGSEYENPLKVVVFLVVLGVLAVMGRLGDLFGTQDRDWFVISGG